MKNRIKNHYNNNTKLLWGVFMAEIKETVFECTNGSDVATITSNEQKWINKINKLAAQRPDDVEIVYIPEDNYGYILAHVTKTFIKLSPPRAVNYTDEQRAVIAERMANARKNRGN